MKKIVVVFGTRPEAIKLATVIEQLKFFFIVKMCVTAQHREMLDSVLGVFNLSPDYDLDIMTPDQDLFDVTCKVLTKIKEVLLKENADMVVVHGDTTTAMATAMAAFYLQIPVAHVEAGLRTYDIYSPFPEEFNRQVVARATRFHFAPTENARQNLLNEKVLNEHIYVTGNTSIDALFSLVAKAKNSNYPNDLLKCLPILSGNENIHPRIILVTGHRRENFGKGLEDICYALIDISKKHPEVEIIYPVHLNPNVRNTVNNILSGINNIHIVEPMDYLSFIKLMDASYMIITDSGGIQEEAPSLGKPVLVTRDTTERIEAIQTGVAILVGSDRKKIVDAAHLLLTDNVAYKHISKIHNPYGDGLASERICTFIKGVL
jgi:UDP-N-acetylglucosamine 2-epimerase (non-hydrolysing)